MHQTLYRKWRPLTFDDVCGQEHITSILRYQVASGKTSHAYLFCGSRGTGKTTCAKLLARAINCENPVNGNPCGECDACRGILSGAITDVIEMDAASNNGVDNIRDIREDVAYAPSECKKRVFIIDEVHMLSTSAFNALLKTLEEPPEHIVFILATTEMHKIPATILSRCQRYDFRRIASEVIVSRLAHIASQENVAIDEDALYLIAKLAQGGMRDAIGMLELCAGAQSSDGTTVTAEHAAQLLGTAPMEVTAGVVRALLNHDTESLFLHIDQIYRQANDISVFWQSLIAFYRDMLVVKSVADPTPLLDLPPKQAALLSGLAKQIPIAVLLYHTRVLDEVLSVLQRNTAPARITVEMALVRMSDPSLDSSCDALLARMEELEARITMGIPSLAQASADTTCTQHMQPAPTAAAPIPADSVQKGSDPSTVSVRKAKPATVPQTASVPPAEPIKPPEADRQERKVLCALRGWQEAVGRVERVNPLVASFLREYKAYTCDMDGCLYLRAPSNFSVNLVTGSSDNIDQICVAVNAVLREARYSAANTVIESLERRATDGYETIDEIIENAGEDITQDAD